MNIFYEIERLVQYGIRCGLVEKLDRIEIVNRLLDIFNLDEFIIKDEDILKIKNDDKDLKSPTKILGNLLDYCAEQELIEENTTTYRDLMDSKIMGVLTPSTSKIYIEFKRISKVSLEAATDYFYGVSKGTNYIRMDRIAKNMHWYSGTEYGDIEITVNLSKPEKDPKAIAAARNARMSSYPKCLLCKENVGYRGRINHPGRQNHRALPITLQEKDWYLQYSPYVYYNEHSIIFSGRHEPMSISEETFDKLLEFVEIFPHYFCGSNADLPIVGGSILSHDHFQGGRHTFPMERSEVERYYEIKGYEDVEVGVVKWPMSVIRIKHRNRRRISELAGVILKKWRSYADEELDIYCRTDEEPHNTVTPIARRRGEEFELDIVLRNNRTSIDHPMGIFHPHNELHHIKKENIGLIEVMGLAVLPGRLKEELQKLKKYLLSSNWKSLIEGDEDVKKHLEWSIDIVEKYDITKENIEEILKDEVGVRFSNVLEHAGVFKRDSTGQEGFKRFIESL